MLENSAIKGNEQLTPDELGYNPETLEPILQFNQVVVEKYPNVLDGVRALAHSNSRYSYYRTARDEVERQYALIKSGADPKKEQEGRFTHDGRYIDVANDLAWKLEPMPEENIPESLRPFVRCPIYYTIDDRSDEVKEKLIRRDIDRLRRSLGDDVVNEEYKESVRDEYYGSGAPGFFYDPNLDIIIMPHWEEDYYYKTVLAHEVGHSIFHQKKENSPKEISADQEEIEADKFAYDHFRNEPWFDAQAIYDIPEDETSK